MKDSIRISILALAKNNNGYFKTEKQAKFLIQMLEESDKGYLGGGNLYGNSFSQWAEWDEKGIIKIYTHKNKSKDTVFFVRAVEGELNELQIKKIKHFEKRIKALSKELDSNKSHFEAGTYCKEGFSAYTDLVINLYIQSIERKKLAIYECQKLIAEVKGLEVENI
jgi:hypothetical protein